jgi:hypothetical protein
MQKLSNEEAYSTMNNWLNKSEKSETAKKQNIILGYKSTWNSTSTTRTWYML